MTRYVIVGAGLAGAKAAEALRDLDADGEIVLIGDEPELPYERPNLSKSYLMGASSREDARVHDAAWYTDHHIDLRTGTRVQSIDRAGHQVRLADGSSEHYDKLLLATGADSRSLPIPGADAPGVLTLRRIGESDRIREVLATAKRLVIIGAGWIGLEVAAAARQAGVEVTVLEGAELPLLRVLGPEVAKVFADLHTEHGVRFIFNAKITGIAVRDGRAVGVDLADGTVVEGDAILMAVGAAPLVQLAVDAGLAVDNGVLVDAGLRTSDPDIYAVGDIAREQHPVLDRPLRVEHWATALNQPAVAAAGMAGGTASYDDLPYFYTDQYDLGMEYVGYVEPGEADQVVIRGDVAAREFIAFWLRDDRVLAGMNVNVWDVVDQVKALITSGARVDPVKLADPAIPLADVIVS